ncbi:MAG: TetR/AcrR family transcriptional regulator [Actinomycetia bacterium]|nr:TetR/AcrR family transcriptional regulator [Actinomycetes bacterium]
MADEGSNWLATSDKRPTSDRVAASRKPSDERWKELLEVSAKLFAEQGYSGTSLQHIADALGMLKGSLYYYIKSKDDLLFEVIKSVYAVGVERFRRTVGDGGDAVERLQRALESHVQYLIDNSTATAVFLHEYERLSDQRKAELAEFDYVGQVRDLIRIGQDQGGFRRDVDPTIAAMSVLGSANWTYRWYRPGTKAPREVAQQLASISVRGLRPEQAESE